MQLSLIGPEYVIFNSSLPRECIKSDVINQWVGERRANTLKLRVRLHFMRSSYPRPVVSAGKGFLSGLRWLSAQDLAAFPEAMLALLEGGGGGGGRPTVTQEWMASQASVMVDDILLQIHYSTRCSEQL